MFKTLSSKDKRVLVISDPHIRYRVVDEIILKEKPNVVIVLGDFFDSHLEIGVGLKEQREMAIWLKSKLMGYNSRPFRGDPRYEFYGLKGNHDLPYCYINKFLKCPGYTEAKDTEISLILKYQDWEKLNDFIILDDFLLTHAGLHPCYIPSSLQTTEELKDWLVNSLQNAYKKRSKNEKHWIYNRGCRMSEDNVGGIFWCDADEEFRPHPKFKQIFGHTYQEKGIKDFGENRNLCIDTFLKNYIIINNGILEKKHHETLY